MVTTRSDGRRANSGRVVELDAAKWQGRLAFGRPIDENVAFGLRNEFSVPRLAAVLPFGHGEFGEAPWDQNVGGENSNQTNQSKNDANDRQY